MHWGEAGYTPDRLPINHSTNPTHKETYTFTPSGNLELYSSQSLDSGRKVKHTKETNRNTGSICKLHNKAQSGGGFDLMRTKWRGSGFKEQS